MVLVALWSMGDGGEKGHMLGLNHFQSSSVFFIDHLHIFLLINKYFWLHQTRKKCRK